VFVLLIGFPSKGTPNTPAGANGTIQQSVCVDEKKEERGNIHYSLVNTQFSNRFSLMRFEV
jgi:hypothetical protein